ncbi:hypothetical protein FACS189485_22590 [Spirochaetia bacterium]|nr:hypothetical protein FACS189485_22590 [Spirochaetia bacterium]
MKHIFQNIKYPFPYVIDKGESEAITLYQEINADDLLTEIDPEFTDIPGVFTRQNDYTK